MVNEQQPQSLAEKAANTLGILALVARVLAVSLEPILHRRMGKRALGMPAFVATIVIPLWGVLFPEDDLAPLFRFWLVFIAGCALNRLFPARSGTHTLYGGDPWLAFFLRGLRRVRGMDEAKLKGVLEPLCAIAAGIAFYPLSHALGTYLMLAGFGLSVSVSLTLAVRQARLEQLSDARIEQEQLASEFRRLRGE